MRSLKKRGPHVLDDLNDLLFSLQSYNSFSLIQCRIHDLGFEGAKSSAEGTRIEAPVAPTVYGVPLPRIFFSFLGLKMRILVRSPAHLECFCTIIRPGPDMHYACPL